MLFEYTAKHDGAAVDTFSRDTGHLVADAHVVFDHLYRKGDVVEVGCWSHARRYFFKALETDPDRARHALALIAGMFVIERKLEQAPPETKLKVRQAETKPIVDASSRGVTGSRHSYSTRRPLPRESATLETNERRSSASCQRPPARAQQLERARTSQGSGRSQKLAVNRERRRRRGECRPSSASSRAANSTGSSPGPTFATSSAFCHPGRSAASWSARPPSGRRPLRSRTLSSVGCQRLPPSRAWSACRTSGTK